MWRGMHLALQNHNILPGEYLKLPVRERIVLMASDQVAAENFKRK